MSDKKEACPGCRNNRYNQPEGYCERPGIDAPVSGEGCWSLKRIKWDKKEKKYVCPQYG